MTSSATIPASRPLVVKFMNNTVTLSSMHFNYMISMSPDSSFYLYANKDFEEPMTEVHDCLGIIAQVVRLSRLRDSGVRSIMVKTHSIEVAFSLVVPAEQRESLLRQAVRAAGLGVAC